MNLAWYISFGILSFRLEAVNSIWQYSVWQAIYIFPNLFYSYFLENSLYLQTSIKDGGQGPANSNRLTLNISWIYIRFTSHDCKTFFTGSVN